jgi:hypothetical protein
MVAMPLLDVDVELVGMHYCAADEREEYVEPTYLG